MGKQIAEVDRWGADRIHVDVMDGHFVLKISFGAVAVEALFKGGGFHCIIGRNSFRGKSKDALKLLRGIMDINSGTRS